MNYLIKHAEKIASALPKGTQKKLSIELGMSDSAIGQYLKGQFTLLANTPNREAKRIEILEAAIKELEPAAELVRGYKSSQLELE
jgi:DNA transposition AAA+ family ATPase